MSTVPTAVLLLVNVIVPRLAKLLPKSFIPVLEEVALEFEAMRIAFGDTADSFARYVRDMKT